MEEGAQRSSLDCFCSMISFYLCFFLFSITTRFCYGDQHIPTDTLIQGQQPKDWHSLYSLNRSYVLQFHSLDSSKDRYLAILATAYINSSHGGGVVRIANRNSPIPDPSGSLMIDPDDGLLKIVYNGGTLPVSNVLASDQVNHTVSSNISVTLLNNGNFVLRQLNRDASINSTLWQSFDYPMDTLLPGMKLGYNLKTGHKWTLTSWLQLEHASMLANEPIQLPSPKQPAFFIETSVGETNDNTMSLKRHSINEISISLMEAR